MLRARVNVVEQKLLEGMLLLENVALKKLFGKRFNENLFFSTRTFVHMCNK
jgi:hypothetical protein